MRIDKLLANMGYGSRKEVKVLLKKRNVIVNDVFILNGKQHVSPEEDVIYVNNKRVYYRAFIYIMMNKAPGYISATMDKEDMTVVDVLSEEYQHFKPFPMGRLDKDTEGLLLLSNDGELAHHLTSPNRAIEKIYYAEVEGIVTDDDIKQFHDGVTLDDGYVTKKANLTILKSDEISEIELTITEGKFHQVKRMFAALGKKVIYLRRIRMGEIELDNSLSLGEFRELNEGELAYCLSLKKQ